MWIGRPTGNDESDGVAEYLRNLRSGAGLVGDPLLPPPFSGRLISREPTRCDRLKQMRRFLWLLFGVVVVASLAYWYQGQQPDDTAVVAGTGLKLTNRPTTFCPTSVQVVIIQTSNPDSIGFDDEVAVENCDQVILSANSVAASGEYQIFVFIPGARALRVVVAGPISTLVDIPIQLGDTNEDNVINEVDQRFVEARIGQTSAEALAADVDGDAQVTILDYSLVATNQGAGQVRPDQKPWRGQ